MARRPHAPLLSADWTNERFGNVLDGVYQLVDRILDSIYTDGFGPLEQPVKKVDLRRLAEQELAQLVDQQLTIESKAELLRDIAKT